MFCRVIVSYRRTYRRHCTVLPSTDILPWSASYWSIRVTRPSRTVGRRRRLIWPLSMAGGLPDSWTLTTSVRALHSVAVSTGLANPSTRCLDEVVVCLGEMTHRANCPFYLETFVMLKSVHCSFLVQYFGYLHCLRLLVGPVAFFHAFTTGPICSSVKKGAMASFWRGGA
jgi:hypothetical protein